MDSAPGRMSLKNFTAPGRMSLSQWSARWLNDILPGAAYFWYFYVFDTTSHKDSTCSECLKYSMFIHDESVENLVYIVSGALLR